MALKMLCGVAKALLSEQANQDTSQTSSDQFRASETSEFLVDERAYFDSYCESNGNRPLIECKDDIFKFVNHCIAKAYQQGGEDFREGVLSQL